ncbi:MAG: type II toxin-antitoxin system HicB family antitoxin [Chloroflexi bacterium]|nr:type II toxin-antitoxin system HicB family antitoxin [Chloroflexota bacterium]MCZ6865965.1 type II toxin-antitoxin system HicB family antitoxin [Chloroflexota bacterium]
MRSIDVVFYNEGKYWVSQALNVEVSSFGETLEESRAAIKEALELYFEDAAESEALNISEVVVERVSV